MVMATWALSVSRTLSQRLLSSSVHLLIATIPSKWLIHSLKFPVSLYFLGNTRGQLAVAVRLPSCTGLSLGVVIVLGLDSDSRKKNTRRQMTRGVRTLDLFGYRFGIFFTPDSTVPQILGFGLELNHGRYGQLYHSQLSCRLRQCNTTVIR